MKKPHILIFNPDQWRGDVLGHLGNPAAVTPVLDECVARDFVSFRGAFCQNPVCTPSRCSFMTGWYPHTRGHRTMHHMLHAERDEPNLLQILKDNGYFVWWGGKNDLVPRENGFEATCDVKYQPPPSKNPVPRDDEAWRGAPDGDNYYSFMRGKLDKGDREFYFDHDWGHILGAIEQINRAPDDQPLCIYLPITYPHPVYAVEEPFFSQIEREKLPPRAPTPDWSAKPSILEGISELQNLREWDEARWTELRATYYGMCARVDHQFGLVLEALREAGIYDDTAVFFFSDHGDFTGDYGLVEKTQNTFEDCLSRVPFLIKPPLNVPVVPRVSDALVELVDFSATVYDLLDIEPNYTSFGRSLLPILAGETDAHRDAVFCEGGRLASETHCKELESASSGNRAGLYFPRSEMQASDGPAHLKAVMCRTRDWKYVRRLGESDELYDLQNDPQELDNRINDPALSEVRAQLVERMLLWFLETGDVVPFQIDKR